MDIWCQQLAMLAGCYDFKADKDWQPMRSTGLRRPLKSADQNSTVVVIWFEDPL
jgi:hypothetical protein